MKNNIINILAAVLLGCGLFFLSSCGSNHKKQLEAAINAINKQFPQQIADGAMLEGFFAEGENIDIAVTLQEEKLATSFDTDRLQRMKKDLILSFTLAARQDKNIRELFQLISDNQRTLSLTITAVPSKKKQSIKISPKDMSQILSSESMTTDEMAQLQLDQLIQSQEQLLPLEQGPVTCTRIYQQDKSVIWEYLVNETVINMDVMQDNAQTMKHDILEAMSASDGLGVVRTVLDAGCHIVYSYKGDTTGTTFQVKLSEQELKEVQRNAVSTKLE